MDKIGLVTITYNSENVLKPFLDCVWSQTYDNFVLYIIDNASSDTSISTLNHEKDSRLRVITNDRNLGVAKANNQGIQKAINEGCQQVLIINNDVVSNKSQPILLFAHKENNQKIAVNKA